MSKNPESRGPGQPEWAPTKDQRRQVSIAKAGGMSNDAIATAIGVARGTLEKHCAVELNEGACQRRLEVLNAMYRTAMKGNVSAQRAYLSAGEPRLVVPPPDPTKPEKPLGKKDQAEEDAKTAAVGTDWDDLIGPRATRQ